MWGLLLVIPRSRAAFALQVSITFKPLRQKPLSDSFFLRSRTQKRLSLIPTYVMYHATTIRLSGNRNIYLLPRFVSGWNWFNFHFWGKFHWDPFSGHLFPFFTHLLGSAVQIILISRRTQSWKALVFEKGRFLEPLTYEIRYFSIVSVSTFEWIKPRSNNCVFTIFFFSRKVKKWQKAPELDYFSP